jgi:hypothetical protein
MRPLKHNNKLTEISAADTLIETMRQKVYTQQDAELQTLLDLNGIIYPLENGFWVKFGAKKS